MVALRVCLILSFVLFSRAFSPIGTCSSRSGKPHVARHETTLALFAVVNKANGLYAEFAIFPVQQSDDQQQQQAELVAKAIQNIESTLKPNAGFVSATVFRSRDGLRVTSYTQWTTPDAYVPTQPLVSSEDFAAPDVHLYEIFAQEPVGSELELSTGMDGLINFGIFKMKQAEHQARFVELFQQALVMVSGQSGLISTHAHRSLDGLRCINFGHWRSVDDFTNMDSNRPFSPLFGEMLDLADNEYQKTLHEVVYTI